MPGWAPNKEARPNPFYVGMTDCRPAPICTACTLHLQTFRPVDEAAPLLTIIINELISS